MTSRGLQGRQRLLPSNLDRFGHRQRIGRALYSECARFHGTILDVGCGRMPHRSMVMAPPSKATSYVGIDLPGSGYGDPHVVWDGHTIPLADSSVECALATEVFEHCPNVGNTMREIIRVLKPGGVLFFTVPFLWPLHDTPHDEYRYTPYSIERHLKGAGFVAVSIAVLGGWDAALAQMLGLWVRRRPMAGWMRRVLSVVAVPLVWGLLARDHPGTPFGEGTMLTGISGTAAKP